MRKMASSVITAAVSRSRYPYWAARTVRPRRAMITLTPAMPRSSTSERRSGPTAASRAALIPTTSGDDNIEPPCVRPSTRAVATLHIDDSADHITEADDKVVLEMTWRGLHSGVYSTPAGDIPPTN